MEPSIKIDDHKERMAEYQLRPQPSLSQDWTAVYGNHPKHRVQPNQGFQSTEIDYEKYPWLGNLNDL